MINDTLLLTLELAITLELTKWRAMESTCWPTPDRIVACPSCKGTGKAPRQKQDTACFDCLGKAWIPRKEAIGQIIASHGDDLQFGGPYCQIAFKAVVDAYVLLRLWVSPELDIYILGDKRFILPGTGLKNKLATCINMKDLEKALELLNPKKEVIQ